MRPLIKNKTAEIYYRNALNNELQRFLDKILATVEESYNTIKVENSSYQHFRQPKKPTPTTFERLMKFIRNNWISILLANTAAIATKFTDIAFANILKSSQRQLLDIGLGTNLQRQDFNEYIKLVIRNNVNLIQNISIQTVNNIENIINDAVMEVKPYSAIYDTLKLQKDIVSERVELIADDQINKFNAGINRFQQQNAGVEYFMWWGVDDARERAGHKELNGKIFKWGDVPERLPVIDEKGTRGYPAEAVRCRCSALAFVPEALYDNYRAVWLGDNKGYAFIESKTKSKVFNREFIEEEHPRDEDGKFAEKGGGRHYTTPEEIKEKQSKVQIDFSRDNYLPELNTEDLEDLGKESKPILLKKNVIDRNKIRHPDLTGEDYILLVQKSLYEPNLIIPANPDKKDYYHFISKINDKDNSTIIIDLKDGGKNYEIVHLHKMRDKSLRNVLKKTNDK